MQAVLRGSYTIETGDNRTESHPAIQRMTVYLVERGLILTPEKVDCKTNEINASGTTAIFISKSRKRFNQNLILIRLKPAMDEWNDEV